LSSAAATTTHAVFEWELILAIKLFYHHHPQHIGGKERRVRKKIHSKEGEGKKNTPKDILIGSSSFFLLLRDSPLSLFFPSLKKGE
jgi:hypothetical protein